MAQQNMTAVEWYRQEIMKVLFASDDNTNIYESDIHEQAKAMEKEQIMKAVDRGYDEGCKFPEDMTLKSAEQYYNETYGNNE